MDIKKINKRYLDYLLFGFLLIILIVPIGYSFYISFRLLEKTAYILFVVAGSIFLYDALINDKRTKELPNILEFKAFSKTRIYISIILLLMYFVGVYYLFKSGDINTIQNSIVIIMLIVLIMPNRYAYYGNDKFRYGKYTVQRRGVKSIDIKRKLLGITMTLTYYKKTEEIKLTSMLVAEEIKDFLTK